MLKHIPDQPTKTLKSIQEIYQLYQTIEEPTRITKTSSTLIDHHATNSTDNIAMQQAKTNYYRDKIALQKDTPKDAWKTINNLLARTLNNTVVNELKLNDRKINSPEELAEAFNNYLY